MYWDNILLIEPLRSRLICDKVPRTKISIIDKPEAFAFEVVAKRVE